MIDAKTFKVAVFKDGSFLELDEIGSVGAARCWARGISHGAKLYGGCVEAYVLAEEEDLMRKQESPEAVKAAMDLVSRDAAEED